MKIAIACERFDPNGGGLEQWTCQLVRELTRRGHEVHVLAFRLETAVSGAHLHPMPWSASRLVRAQMVNAALANLNADITHDLGVCWSADILQPQAGSGRANRRQDRISCTFSELGKHLWRPSYWKWLLEVHEFENRQYANCKSTVIAVSRMVAGHMQELHGVPPERIRIVPNGVDTQKVSPSVRTAQRDEMRRRLHIQRDETLFLFAAHNPRLKGIRPLLRALAELRRGQPGAVLAVIGKDPPAGIRQTAARLNIEDSIRFAGYVDAPLSYYAAADAFVLPTFYDACSLTVLEACACALPVITSKYNGVSELMTHGREGWIIDNPRDFRELAQAMAHCADAAHSGSMSAAARELALRNTMEQNVTAIERVYLECLAHRRREIGKS